jgi:hypothetical protein
MIKKGKLGPYRELGFSKPVPRGINRGRDHKIIPANSPHGVITLIGLDLGSIEVD